MDSAAVRDMVGEAGLGGRSNIQLAPHGYVAMMSAPTTEDGMRPPHTQRSMTDLVEQSAIEDEFFRSNGLRDLVEGHRAGMGGLVHRMSMMCHEYLKVDWAVLVSVHSHGLPPTSVLSQTSTMQ